jgi:Protein of unknown function (DUF3617)
MTKKSSIGLTMLFCSMMCFTLRAADYRALDVKTGEWQITMTSQTSGTPPIPEEVLNRLTPEQRAKLLTAMQARNGKSTVHKSCLTKDQLDKPFNTGDEATKACSPTLITSSGNKQEIRIDCNREGFKATGTVKVEALDSEDVKGSMTMIATNGDHSMNMNNSFVSKWIGPACTEPK